nr:uncharacterized protein LOC113713325 [Coffea arabica]
MANCATRIMCFLFLFLGFVVLSSADDCSVDWSSENPDDWTKTAVCPYGQDLVIKCGTTISSVSKVSPSDYYNCPAVPYPPTTTTKRVEDGQVVFSDLPFDALSYFIPAGIDQYWCSQGMKAMVHVLPPDAAL